MSGVYRPLRRLPLWRGCGWLGIGVIVAVSLLPPAGLPTMSEGTDKAWHALAYAVASAWTVQLVAVRAALAWRLLGLVVLGVVLEFAQMATGYRSGEVGDAVANALGVLLGGAVAFTRACDLLQRWRG